MPPTILRHLGSGTATAPFPASIERRSIAVNTANLQIAVGAESGSVGAPLSLLAVRFFTVTGKYVAGDVVLYNGALYKANTAISPGAFAPGQWDVIAISPGAGSLYVAKAGDTMSGDLTINKDTPGLILNTTALTQQNVIFGRKTGLGRWAMVLGNTNAEGGTANGSDFMILRYDNTGNYLDMPFLIARGDGRVYLSGDPTAALQAATKQYVDTRVLKAGDTMSGLLTLSADPSTALQAATKQYVDNRVSVGAVPTDVLAYSGLQVNGNFEVSQEFAMSADTSLLTGNNRYIADGWLATNTLTGAVLNTATWGVGPSSSNYLKLVVNTVGTVGAATYAGFYSFIEGYRWARLRYGAADAQPVTISFWIWATVAGTYSVGVRNYAGTRAYATPFTTGANAWEYKTVTIPGDTTGAWNLAGTGTAIINVTGASGSNYMMAANTWAGTNTFAVTGQSNAFGTVGNLFLLAGVSIMPGSQSPPSSLVFMRPYDQELQTCQRYYQKSYPIATIPGTNLGASNGYLMYQHNVAALVTPILLKGRMRTSPTLTFYDNAGVAGKVTAYVSNVWTNNQTAPSLSGSGSSDSSFSIVSNIANATYICFDWTASARM